MHNNIITHPGIDSLYVCSTVTCGHMCNHVILLYYVQFVCIHVCMSVLEHNICDCT